MKPTSFLGLLGATTCLLLCLQSLATADDAASPKSSSSEREPTKVHVLSLQKQSFTQNKTYVARTEPHRRILIKAERDGIVEKVFFDKGSNVTKGQVLAHIATNELKVRLDLAQADLELAESNYQRQRPLADQKLISPSQLEETTYRFRNAKLQRQLAEIELNKSKVTSPIQGAIRIKEIEEGEFIRRGDVITEILELSPMKVVLSVPEQELLFFSIGKSAELEFYLLPGQIFKGKVSHIAVESNPNNRTFEVEVLVPNLPSSIRSGVLTQVTFALQSYDDQVVIPRHAILERENQKQVYVVKDGVAQVRQLEVGGSFGTQVRVLSGVSEGEQLVVTGQRQIIDGEKVQVVERNP